MGFPPCSAVNYLTLLSLTASLRVGLPSCVGSCIERGHSSDKSEVLVRPSEVKNSEGGSRSYRRRFRVLHSYWFDEAIPRAATHFVLFECALLVLTRSKSSLVGRRVSRGAVTQSSHPTTTDSCLNNTCTAVCAGDDFAVFPPHCVPYQLARATVLTERGKFNSCSTEKSRSRRTVDFDGPIRCHRDGGPGHGDFERNETVPCVARHVCPD